MIGALLFRLTNWAKRGRLRRSGVEFEDPIRIDGRLPLITNGGTIVLGSGACLRGVPDAARLTTASTGRIVIGKNAYLNTGVQIYSAASVEIGPDARIADYCVISDSNFHAVHEGDAPRIAPIRIAHNTWLGRGVIVLPGVAIGAHSVVSAGSVVTRDIPDKQVWGGNPAVFLKQVRASDSFRRS